MKKRIFAILFSLLLTLGCVGRGGSIPSHSATATPVDGVVINSLDIVPREVFKGDDFTLRVDLENDGTYKTSGYLYVYGPAWLNPIHESFELNPADPVNNIPGGRKTIVEELRANADIPERTKQQYTLYVRTCYDYRSLYLATVVVYSREESLVTRGNVFMKRSTQTTSPISIEMVGAPKYYTSKGKLYVVFRIKNIGDGFPASSECTPSQATPSFENTNRIKRFILESSIGSVRCIRNSDIYLSNGEATIECTIENIPSNVPKLQLTLKAIATYTYYVTRSTVFTVMGGE